MRSIVGRTINGNGDTQTVVVPVSDKQMAGQIAVYAQRVSGAGTATVAADGGFSRNSTNANDWTSIKAATAIGTGVVTAIQALVASTYPYVRLTVVSSGTSVSKVWVVGL